jgi:hypothetical protein
MATVAPIACPDCGGEMWNNIGTKKNPKQPDYKCKDKDSCGKGVWIDKKKGGGKADAEPAAPVEPPTPPKSPDEMKAERSERLRLLLSLRRLCAQHILTAENPAMQTGGVDPFPSTAARINDLFDVAVREGLAK